MRVFGIPEVEREDSQSQVIDFFNNVLKVEIKPEDIDQITHRIGRRDRDALAVSQSAPDSRRSQHRPIIVKFISRRSKVFVMGSKKDLKDTGYSISSTNLQKIEDDKESGNNQQMLERGWKYQICQKRRNGSEDHKK